MTVDITKIQVGDTVHFRCGGSEVVKRVVSMFRNDLVSLSYKDGDYMQTVTHNGKFYQGRPHIFDIIRVTPRALTPEDRLARIAEIAEAEFQYSKLKPDGAAGRILRLARGEP